MSKSQSKTPAGQKSESRARKAADTAPSAARSGSKAEAVIKLLASSSGGTLEQMMKATGWQKHSVRGFISGTLKKRHGITVSSERTSHGRIYRVDRGAQG